MVCTYSCGMMMGRESSSGELLVKGERYTFDGQGCNYI